MKISTSEPLISGIYLKRFPFEEKEKFQPLKSELIFRIAGYNIPAARVPNYKPGKKLYVFAGCSKSFFLL